MQHSWKKINIQENCCLSQTDGGTEFRRTHHTVRKSTPYDMGVDPSCKYAAVGCQDRSVRWVCARTRACLSED